MLAEKEMEYYNNNNNNDDDEKQDEISHEIYRVTSFEDTEMDENCNN